jgi:hypothetical protein
MCTTEASRSLLRPADRQRRARRHGAGGYPRPGRVVAGPPDDRDQGRQNEQRDDTPRGHRRAVPAHSRSSIATFFLPNIDEVIAPLPGTAVDGALYEPISTYDWQHQFMTKYVLTRGG